MNPTPSSVTHLAWALPALQQATNPAAMHHLLAPLLLSAFPDGRYRLQTATVVDGKAKERAIVRYMLTTADASLAEGQGPPVLLGKLYANPSRAMQVYTAMNWLWREVFAHAPEIGVPRPLGLLSELAMVVYVPVEGSFLNELLTQERADYWLALTATWLGYLHQQAPPPAKQFDLANELVNLRAWARLIGQNYPTLFAAANQLVDYLAEEAAHLPLQGKTPIHKDFHYQHVLVNGRLAVIDFDELRLGDPNFDLAHFCANLHLLAYRTPQMQERIPQLQQTFLDAYGRQTGWSADQRFLYFFIYTCVKLAKQLCTQRGPRPRPTGAEQQRQVQMILAEGMARLRD